MLHAQLAVVGRRDVLKGLSPASSKAGKTGKTGSGPMDCAMTQAFARLQAVNV